MKFKTCTYALPLTIHFHSPSRASSFAFVIFCFILATIILPKSFAKENNGLHYLEQHWIDNIFTERDLRSFEASYGLVQSSGSLSSIQLLSLPPYTSDEIERKKKYAEYTKFLLEKKKKFVESEKIRKRQTEIERKEQLERDLISQREREKEEKARLKRENENANNRAIKWVAGILFGVLVLGIVLCILKPCFRRYRSKNTDVLQTRAIATTRDSISSVRNSPHQFLEQVEFTTIPQISLIPQHDVSEVRPSAPPRSSILLDFEDENDPPPKYEDVVAQDTQAQRMKNSTTYE